MSVKFITAWIFALALFCACGRAEKQEPSPRFTIETPAQTRSGCALIALEDNGTLHVEQSAARVALPRFIEIRQEGKKLPLLLARNFVSLSNGDRLPLDADASARLEESRLHLWPAKSLPVANAKGLDLFAPNVVLLFRSLPDGVDEAERFFARLQDEPRKRDVVFLQNGDRIEGTIAALGPKIGCVIATDGRKVQTPWPKLAGIAWSTDRQARLRTKKTYTRAVLEGGARVNFLELRFEEKVRRWVGKTQFGATVELSEASLIALDVRQGMAVDVSEMTPARYEHRPFLGAVWPLAKDAAATGQPLRLNGSTYEKGLGTHAACQVAYELHGNYQRFDALVGIDEMARRGRARAAIDLDGKRIELNEGKELTSQSAPLAVQLDVRNVRTMTLIVELGSFGDVQADLNWAKARLIKKESESTKDAK
jgi:NPCBM/NEW2 domain